MYSIIYRCIPVDLVCNSDVDCLDLSDEDQEMCANWTCPGGFWRCMDGHKCIPDDKILDGHGMECPDGSDEMQQYHIGRPCPEDYYNSYYKCNNTEQCIMMSQVCDGTAQCSDSSDEGDFCFYWECHEDYWKCGESPKCIYTGSGINTLASGGSRVCDGVKDCLVCSEYGNCTDISDETNTLCICAEDEWPCKDTDGCVKKLQVCDGYKNCNDGSDEAVDYCVEWECLPGYGKCHDVPQCVAWCDGRRQCSNGVDENNCEVYDCVEGKQKCADNKQCVDEKDICDGSTQCLDGSDELCNAPCLQSPVVGKGIVKKCSEDIAKCFPFSQFCDRVGDCPLGSDEADSGCSCQDWDLQQCTIENVTLCIYPEWLAADNLEVLPCEMTRQKRSLQQVHDAILGDDYLQIQPGL